MCFTDPCTVHQWRAFRVNPHCRKNYNSGKTFFTCVDSQSIWFQAVTPKVYSAACWSCHRLGMVLLFFLTFCQVPRVSTFGTLHFQRLINGFCLLDAAMNNCHSGFLWWRAREVSRQHNTLLQLPKPWKLQQPITTSVLSLAIFSRPPIWNCLFCFDGATDLIAFGRKTL